MFKYEYDVFWVAYASVNNVEAVTEAQSKKTLNIKKAEWSETANDWNTDELTIDNIRYKRYNGVWKIWNGRLYTGREYDAELKLYYNRARYYSPDLGKFISRDPIDITDDVNLYAYVGNNGVMFVDRMGLSKILIITILWKESSNYWGEIIDYSNRSWWLIDTINWVNDYDSNKYITKLYKSDHYGISIDLATDYIISMEWKYDNLVIVWHSLWWDNAVNITNNLNADNIDVDLLITLDIKAFYENDTIYDNVLTAINYYQNNDEFPRNWEDLEKAFFNDTTYLENYLIEEVNWEKVYHTTIDNALSDVLLNLIKQY
jgi:RHS repeat-associated protein